VAYKVADRWNADDIRVVLLSDVSEGGIVTVEVTMGAISLRIMGEIREDDRRLAAVGAHISSTGIKPNEVGIANLRRRPIIAASPLPSLRAQRSNPGRRHAAPGLLRRRGSSQ